MYKKRHAVSILILEDVRMLVLPAYNVTDDVATKALLGWDMSNDAGGRVASAIVHAQSVRRRRKIMF